MRNDFWLEICRQLAMESARASVREVCVLHWIIENPGGSIGELATDMWDNDTHSSASMIARRWEDRGLVEVKDGAYSNTPNYARTSVRINSACERMIAGQSEIKFKPIVRKCKNNQPLFSNNGDYWKESA